MYWYLEVPTVGINKPGFRSWLSQTFILLCKIEWGLAAKLNHVCLTTKDEAHTLVTGYFTSRWREMWSKYRAVCWGKWPVGAN